MTQNYLDRFSKNTTSNQLDKQFVKLPWTPIIGPKLRREFKKQNISNTISELKSGSLPT